MFNVIGEINWLGAVGAGIAAFMIGGVWFAVLLAKPYARALGRENAPQGKVAPLVIIGSAVWSFLTAIISAVLMRALGVESMGDALMFSLIIGLGYLAATTTNTAINPNIPRPLLYGLVSGSYHFVAAVVICLILVFVR